jgi:hypothetical protein
LAATLGAVIGIAVGDALVSAIGRAAIQVKVVAVLAMSAAVQPPHGFYSPAAARRLVDVLIGGATSLAVLILLPAHTLLR